MQFKYLKTVKCPHCGCETVVRESLQTTVTRGQAEVMTHTSGGQWEKRDFLCGFSVEYIPNFQRDELGGYCTRSIEYIAMQDARAQTTKKLKDVLEESAVDKHFREAVLSDLDRVRLW